LALLEFADEADDDDEAGEADDDDEAGEADDDDGTGDEVGEADDDDGTGEADDDEGTGDEVGEADDEETGVETIGELLSKYDVEVFLAALGGSRVLLIILFTLNSVDLSFEELSVVVLKGKVPW
jgi:hypothetical protein